MQNTDTSDAETRAADPAAADQYSESAEASGGSRCTVDSWCLLECVRIEVGAADPAAAIFDSWAAEASGCPWCPGYSGGDAECSGVETCAADPTAAVFDPEAAKIARDTGGSTVSSGLKMECELEFALIG